MAGRTSDFLWKASKAIPARPRPRRNNSGPDVGLGQLDSSSLTLRLLRSRILTKWKNAVLKEQVPVSPKTLRKSSSMCSFCNGSLEGSSHIKVMPTKKMGTKMKRVVKKYNLSGAFNFTKCEKVLWRKYQANIGNTLILTCISCQNKITIPMEKPTSLEISNQESAAEQPAKKKKKKKAKDHLAGLKMSVVTKSSAPIVVGSKLKVDAHVECNKDNNQSKKKNKLAQDIQTANLKTKPKTQSILPLKQKRHAWQSVPEASGMNTVAFKKFKKCNKLSEILAKSSNGKPQSQTSKPMSMLNSLQLMLRKNNA